MSEDHPDNVVLALLRALRADVAEIKEINNETRMRLYALELNYIALRPQLDRVERIIRRLELAESTT